MFLSVFCFCSSRRAWNFLKIFSFFFVSNFFGHQKNRRNYVLLLKQFYYLFFSFFDRNHYKQSLVLTLNTKKMIPSSCRYDRSFFKNFLKFFVHLKMKKKIQIREFSCRPLNFHKFTHKKANCIILDCFQIWHMNQFYQRIIRFR